MNINDLKNGMCLVLKNNEKKYIIDNGVYHKESARQLKFDYSLEGMKDLYLSNMRYKAVNYGLDIMKVIDADGKIIYERIETDWDKVPVDTKVWVSDNQLIWYKRHFFKYENGNFYTYFTGRTSWSKNGENDIEKWNYCELPKEDSVLNYD